MNTSHEPVFGSPLKSVRSLTWNFWNCPVGDHWRSKTNKTSAMKFRFDERLPSRPLLAYEQTVFWHIMSSPWKQYLEEANRRVLNRSRTYLNESRTFLERNQCSNQEMSPSYMEGWTMMCIPENFSGSVSIHWRHFSIDCFCSRSSTSSRRLTADSDEEPVEIEWIVPSDSLPLRVMSLFFSEPDAPALCELFSVWHLDTFLQFFTFSSLRIQFFCRLKCPPDVSILCNFAVDMFSSLYFLIHTKSRLLVCYIGKDIPTSNNSVFCPAVNYRYSKCLLTAWQQ